MSNDIERLEMERDQARAEHDDALTVAKLAREDLLARENGIAAAQGALRIVQRERDESEERYREALRERNEARAELAELRASRDAWHVAAEDLAEAVHELDQTEIDLDEGAQIEAWERMWAAKHVVDGLCKPATAAPSQEGESDG